jgi:CzcA family heavy metal efflux pump
VLNWIISFSLQNRLLIIAAALLLSAYGAYDIARMPVDVLPDLNRPTVTIMCAAQALPPEEVERQVTWPIEQVLNGASGVTRVRSTSTRGLSVVYVEFGWETDIIRNRQVVQEKLQLAQGKLPPGAELELAPMSSVLGQTQLIGIRSKDGKVSVSELRAIADQSVTPRLLSIPGVAQVVAIGGAPRQLQVTVDVEKLRAFDVSLLEVEESVKAANLNASGGTMQMGWKGPQIMLSGRIAAAAQLETAVVRADAARPIQIKDVARVEFGPAPVRFSEAGVNNSPGVILFIFKQPGTDTLKLTEKINKELADYGKSLPEGVQIVDDVFQQSAFINRAIDNVVAAVRDGAILVVIVLFAFLMNMRTTLITLTALPLSVAVTAIVFAAFGFSINTMTLGGIAVAIGALVDDAIVDVENVFRRLRQNATAAKPLDALVVVFKASSEVRNPILIGTLLVVVVYLPLFFLSGLEGRLFTPIGVAYIISTLASLVVSLTVTPVLCYYLLGRRTVLAHTEDNWLVRNLKNVASGAIKFSMRHTAAILGVLVSTVIVALFALATRGSQFLPTFNEGTAQVNLVLPPGVSLETSDSFGRRLDTMLSEIKGVRNVGRRTGRGGGDEATEDVNSTEAIVTFEPNSGRTRAEIIAEVREKLETEFPGVATEVEQPLAHLLSHLLSGVNAQVAVKVFGPDIHVLQRTTEEIEAALKPIAGVEDLHTQPLVLVDQLSIEPRRERLAQSGVTVKEIADTIALSGGEEEVSRITIGQVAYPVIVRLESKDRQNLAALNALQLRASTGGRVALSDVAEVKMSKTPNNIVRENVSRRMVVQHNVAGRSLGEVVADVEKALEPIRAKLAAQPGYSIRLSGQFEAQAEATRLIIILSFVSLIAMFFILFLHFRSLNLSLQVMLSIPMAFIGAAAFIVASGQTMSVATLVGLISLGGIAARNAILLLDHYLHLMREEREPFSEQMIIRAGQERMLPVLMTALCSGIALVPLALSPDEPGREILYPVATVIIGGLLSSTILDFLVTPGIFWTLGRRDAERLAAETSNESDGFAVRPSALVMSKKEELSHG